MSRFTDEELLAMIETGESDRVEFKESLSGNAPGRIREAICAFANDLPANSEPCLIFVGVKDNKTIGTVQITDELLRQLADMKTDGNIVPPPSMTVEKRVLDEKEVAIVRVDPLIHRQCVTKVLFMCKRVPVEVLPLRQMKELLTKNGDMAIGLLTFILSKLPVFPISIWHYSITSIYLQAVSEEILALNERTLNEQLAATKMVIDSAEPTPTVLGILAIGKNPQDFLYGAYIQFLRIDGNELSDPIIDSQEIRGAVSDQIRRLDDKLIAHNRVAVDIISGPIEKRTTLYPIEALQQITRNAIMHRTYEGTNAPVRVNWFNNRIDIASPGGTFGGVTADNFGDLGLTDYRNPNLAEAMRTLGFVQRFGIGIPIARRLSAENGNPAPEFKIYDTAVIATIHGRDRK